VLRTGATWTVATEPADVVTASGADSFAALDDLSPGFWAGFATYELGHAVERVRPGRASGAAGAEPSLPDLLLVRFARRRTVDRLADRPPVDLGPARRTSLDRDDYRTAAETVLAHIGGGDCYQVNLTRTITWDDAADAGALFRAVVGSGRADDAPPHAAWLRLPTARGPVDVVSASPERFLAWQGRAVETRPIKGTAPRAEALTASAKDRAENVMIVDLARNDLGRVCQTGSIHVPALCATERHPGLAHLVSTVRGRLRDGVGLGALVRATFAPASITGAPKPRVLQIIEDLESSPRGVYCGAVGWIDTERACGDLAVAIRTFTVAGGRTTFGVGAGVVADSAPDREWDETELKAARLLDAAGAFEPWSARRPAAAVAAR
jgi:para-aminobenzoate synthetase component 1